MELICRHHNQRDHNSIQRHTLMFVASCVLLVANQALAAISISGNVSPAYPGGGLDPWNVAAELVVGNAANGSLGVSSGSDVTSAGGSVAFDQSVAATVIVSGSGSTWTNSQDLVVGVFGDGQLQVLQSGRVTNRGASLGHINGAGTVLVEDAGSEWLNSEDVYVGNGGSGSLAIQLQGRVTSRSAWIGLNSSAVGMVTIDGQNSRWEIAQTLALGDVADSGQATLTLSGAGSRLYIGSAAVTHGSGLPAPHTALIVSDNSGLAGLSIYAGNTLNNAGNGYIGFGAGESGSVTIDGANSEWKNVGDVAVGVDGAAALTLVSGGKVSATGLLSVGPLGALRGNGTVVATTQNAGTIAPGLSAGSLNVTGSYSQLTTGKLEIELFGTTAGQFDTLSVSGAATLGGKLKVTLGIVSGNPFDPQLGDAFTFLNAASGVIGNFAAADLPHLAAGRMWQVRYGANATTLAVTVAGDYNDNGVVDAADYVVWRKLNGTALSPRADGDTNGVTNAADFAIWRGKFGSSSGAGTGAGISSALSVVPEPPTIGLTLIVLVLAQVLLPQRPIGTHGSCDLN